MTIQAKPLGHAATALALVALATPAAGAGWYNLPTSLPQCLGLGWGPGYHAPMLLGPALKARTASQDLRRLRAPLPLPPSAHLFGHASVMPAFSHPHPTHDAYPSLAPGPYYGNYGSPTPAGAAYESAPPPPSVSSQPVVVPPGTPLPPPGQR